MYAAAVFWLQWWGLWRGGVRYLCACFVTVYVCIWIICFRGSRCLQKPSVLTVNPEVHRVYLDLVTRQKISNNKHPSVSLSLSYKSHKSAYNYWDSTVKACQAAENMNVHVRMCTCLFGPLSFYVGMEVCFCACTSSHSYNNKIIYYFFSS